MTISADLALAWPELILAVGALTLLVIGAFAPKQTALVGSGSVVVLLAAALASATQPFGVAFGGGLISDAAATFAKVAIYLASAVAIPLGQSWFARRGVKAFEFPVLILLASLGMGMMVGSGDLISLYMGVELQSLALYVLAAMHRDNAKASEAGLKYFVLGALSSGLLLYGASLIYGFAGSTLYSEISLSAGAEGNTGLLFGLVFLICGIAFKVSAAPFHMWTPDVYEGAPTPGSRRPQRPSSPPWCCLRVFWATASPPPLTNGNRFWLSSPWRQWRSGPSPVLCSPTSSGCGPIPPSPTSATRCWACRQAPPRVFRPC